MRIAIADQACTPTRARPASRRRCASTTTWCARASSSTGSATPRSAPARLGQLNQGESANALHRYIGFGNRGRVYARDPEQLQRNMDCRRLISNIIVLWNTRYIAHALETLER